MAEVDETIARVIDELRFLWPKAREIMPDTGIKRGNVTARRCGMTDEEILTRITRILRDILSDNSIVLTMQTRRENVRNWDSFNYINFIVAVEIEFGVKFKVADIESFENVGEIVAQMRVMLGGVDTVIDGGNLA